MPDVKVINDYDSEPVRYCAKCYSLKIKYEDSKDADYCADCGCFDITDAPIEVWEEKYEKRYGHKFAVKTEDPKKTFVFNLSIEDLKKRVYHSEKWKQIIYSLYPKFPGGYSKADSIILFFHQIVKDNKISDLKMLLLKLIKY